MKSNIIFLISLLFIGIYANRSKKNDEIDDVEDPNELTEFKTFVIKTKLTKEELEELILKNNKDHKINIEEIKNENQNNSNNEELIEEVKKDNLNNKAFISKEETKANNFFYEKKYGKTYAYLTLFISIILIIYIKNMMMKGKNDCKINNNGFEYEDIKEYMLVKSE